MTQAYRNWNEARGRHIGEILSGVNRNAENIVQLQTDYTAADGAVTSAYISADAVVAADAESARATLTTTLTAAYQSADTAVANGAVTYTDAQIVIEQGVRAAADTAEATARQTLEASLTKAAVQLAVDNFDADGFYWTGAFGGAPESVSDPANVTYSDVANIGRVLETSTYALYLTPKAAIKPYVGLKIRIEAKVRATVDPSSGSLTVVLADINGLSSAWAHGAPSFTSETVSGYSVTEAGLTVSDGWVTIARVYTCSAISTYDAGWRPRLDVTHSGSGGTVQVAYFKIEDVTEAQDIRASVTSEETARVAADSAEATARLALQTSLESADSTIQANVDTNTSAISTETSARASADTSLQSQITSNDTDIAGNASNISTNTASISSNYTTLVAADTAEATARETLEANIQIGSAAFAVDNFDADGYHWFNGFGGAPDTVSDPSNATYSDVASIGRVLETSTFTYFLQPKAVVRPEVGTRIRVEVKLRATVDSSGTITAGITANGLTSTWGHDNVSLALDSIEGYSSSSSVAVADGWVTIAGILRCTAKSTGDVAWRPRIDISNSGSGGTIQVAYFKIEDATDLYARVEVLREAFVDSNGDALAQFSVTAAAGGNPARLSLLDGAGGSNIALDADEIFFGSDTVFENTHDTFYTTGGSYRYRDRGPFGTSGDLLQWYGPTSVALNSETKTNGVWSMATDGKVRLGSDPVSALQSASVSPVTDSDVTSASFGTLGGFTVSTIGGDGTYTYSTAQLTGSTSVFTIVDGTTSSPDIDWAVTPDGTSYEATFMVTVTETSTSRVAQVIFSVLLVTIPPP